MHRTEKNILEPASPVDVPRSDQPRLLVGVWSLVCLFSAIAVFRSHEVAIPFRDPHGTILRNRLLISSVLFAGLVLVDGIARSDPRARRPSAVARLIRHRWTRQRVSLAIAGLLAYHVVYFCYHNLKSWVALEPVRDGMLARWDHWLFLGHTPAVVLHDLLGQHIAAYVLMGVYESFTPVVSVCVVASMVFVERVEDGYVFIASALWVWILGVSSYYLIPSIGPFHNAPGDFSGLPHTLVQDTQTQYVAQRAQLLAHPHAHDSFAQLGAFASLHVAMTTLLLLMAHHYGLRRTTRAAAVFVCVTMVATVYLGWHYAVDDIAGVAIALVSTLFGRTTVGCAPFDRHDPVRIDTHHEG